MKKILKKIIKKSDFTFVLYKVIKHRKDKAFLKSILYGDPVNNRKILIEPKDGNIGRAPILIIKDFKKRGMGASLRRILDQLYVCERYGFLPYVDMSDSYYYVDCRLGNNPFDYFFIQPLVNSQMLLDANPKVLSIGVLEFDAEYFGENNNSYEATSNYLDKMSSIWNRYIKFNDACLSSIDTNKRNLRINNNTLGIHIRGTDFKACYENHPKYIDPSYYVPLIDEALIKYGFDKIFIATDDIEILAFFENKYKSLIVFLDNKRGKGCVGIHSDNSDDSISKYELGLQVLCDIALLSYCGGIISGVSQVSLCARIYKKSRNEFFRCDETINHGMNNSDNHF